MKIPEDVPLEIVGPLGCGIQTGAGTVLNSLAVPAGSSIVVTGTGAVGLSAIMAAKVAGATTIIAVDVLDERLDFATKLGATHTVNGSTDDVVATILEITDGLGADYAVDDDSGSRSGRERHQRNPLRRVDRLGRRRTPGRLSCRWPS
ncbi:zinc-binding dehydrogenase [Aeromicrobium sp. UC242_57]|uniref:zinc-binding dehydrogenase n=1 Tax=Aeromicrobium sp. UC242_57 TaxID=3374624 RepID=UPI0037877FA7